MKTLSIISKCLLLALTLPLVTCAQEVNRQELHQRLKQHIRTLASDEYGGRLTGTIHELKAATYIAGQLAEYGVEPGAAGGSYLQPFAFVPKVRYGEENALTVGEEPYELQEEYYPLPYSGTGAATGTIVDAGYAIISESEDYNDFEKLEDLEGKVLLVNLGLPKGSHPHAFMDQQSWRSRVMTASQYEPAAILFYNTSDDLSLEQVKRLSNYHAYPFPLVVLRDVEPKQAKKLRGKMAVIKVDLQPVTRTGHNVLGLVDNGQPETIVIGAHYDHLGRGEYGSSMLPESTDIHNGADDNASGTAALIELARLVQTLEDPQHNYLFLAFSGEEQGLLGSNFFTKNPVLNLAQTEAMLNMDMVGRLGVDGQKLGIHGTGTSMQWDSLIALVDVGEPVAIATTESGMGASDHTSFYLADIPALHFFTGTHSDYHKPSDDWDKINYEGTALVTTYIFKLLQHLDRQEELTFQKTKGNTRNTPRFKVTLGIMPDYFGDAEGLRVQGVSENEPADKAGMRKGDVIVKMGEYEVKDIMSYMEALGRFEPGEKAEVEVLRDKERKKLHVQF